MVYNGKSYWSGWFWGYPYFRKPPDPQWNSHGHHRALPSVKRPSSKTCNNKFKTWRKKKVSINDAVMEPVSVIYILYTKWWYTIYYVYIYIYYGSSMYILSDFMDVRPPQNCWRIPVWPQSLRGVLIILTHFLYLLLEARVPSLWVFKLDTAPSH